MSLTTLEDGPGKVIHTLVSVPSRVTLPKCRESPLWLINPCESSASLALLIFIVFLCRRGASNRYNNYIVESLVRSCVSRCGRQRLLAQGRNRGYSGQGKHRGKRSASARCLQTARYLLCAQALCSCACLRWDNTPRVDPSLGFLPREIRLPVSARPLHLSSLEQVFRSGQLGKFWRLHWRKKQTNVYLGRGAQWKGLKLFQFCVCFFLSVTSIFSKAAEDPDLILSDCRASEQSASIPE